MANRWLLTGGARSGKSRFAVDRAVKTNAPVTIITTAEAIDDEMTMRISAHQQERPANWTTIEEPLALTDAVKSVPSDHTLIIDCLVVWLGNMYHYEKQNNCEQEIAAFVVELQKRSGITLIVTNDVGLGVVPESELGRIYRDQLGRINSTVAKACDKVLFFSAGHAMELQPTETWLS